MPRLRDKDILQRRLAQRHELLRELVEAFPNEITSVSLGKPSLEDVFIAKTGHRFWDDGGAGEK
jgi:ABC-2 type transport system ATP-binding protein